MELILNDLSFDGQFQSREEFVEYVIDVLMPLLDVVIENSISLLKRSDIYSLKITCEETMQDLLMRTDDPVMSLLKNYIVNLGYCEPYWDLNILTNSEVNYDYPALADEPNCFTEAIERNGKLLSLRHLLYEVDKFICRKDDEEIEISNIIKVEKLLKEILLEDKAKIRYIIENYPYKRSIVCAEVNGKCFAEEAFLKNGLEIDDLINIVEALPRLIEDLEQGHKSKLWDKLREDIFEFRLHVSSNRIFRLLFVQNNGIQFLNGFIKKTQKTPPAEIDKAVEIKKQII